MGNCPSSIVQLLSQALTPGHSHLQLLLLAVLQISADIKWIVGYRWGYTHLPNSPVNHFLQLEMVA